MRHPYNKPKPSILTCRFADERESFGTLQEYEQAVFLNLASLRRVLQILSTVRPLPGNGNVKGYMYIYLTAQQVCFD